MVPGKPLYSLTCAWSSRYNPVTEVEGPGADGDTDVILYMSLLDYAVAAVMTAHFQMLYTLLLLNRQKAFTMHVHGGTVAPGASIRGLLLLVFATQGWYPMPALAHSNLGVVSIRLS